MSETAEIIATLHAGIRERDAEIARKQSEIDALIEDGARLLADTIRVRDAEIARLSAPPGTAAMPDTAASAVRVLAVAIMEGDGEKAACALRQYGDDRVAAAKAETAPPGADVMERAAAFVRDVAALPSDEYLLVADELFDRIAAALQAYGDERAREATALAAKPGSEP